MSLRQMLDSATPREKQNIETLLRRTWRQYHPTPEQIRARNEQEQEDESINEQGEERR